MKTFMRILAAGALVVSAAACSGGTSVATPPAAAVAQPTPQIVYVTPAPTVAPVVVATPEPTVQPVGDLTADDPTIDESVDESLDTPLTPLGQWATVGDWNVRFTKVNWNAGAALKKANMFNDRIPKGKTAVMAWVEAKFNGTGREEFDFMGNLKAYSADGTEYTQFDGTTCGVMPKPDMTIDAPKLRHNGVAKGWGACFIVPNSQVKSLTAFDDDWNAEETVDFKLR